MKRTRVPLAILVFTASMIANVSALPEEGRRLVLVTGDQTSVGALTPDEVRKLYLGVSVARGGRTVLPLRNQTDPLLQEVFLQKIMFMSGAQYERTLATRLIRTENGIRPPAYDSPKELYAALRATPGTVTYMWEENAKVYGVKVVAELWQEKRQ